MRPLLLALLSTLLLSALVACSAPKPYSGGRVERLTTVDEVVGQGPQARPGDVVQVNYTGWLYDEQAKDHRGEKFDASADHKTPPFQFTLGASQVIGGWDQGIVGMHVGGRRLLLIPPELGYGDRGAGGAIPPGASLVFEVELTAIQPR